MKWLREYDKLFSHFGKRLRVVDKVFYTLGDFKCSWPVIK